MLRSAIHFVGFRGDEYTRAVRIFGCPDFIHIKWDRRAQREIAENDTVIFARGSIDDEPNRYNAPDLIE